MAAIIAVHHSHPGGLWAAAVIVLAVAAFMAALRMFWTADIWKGE
jgi:hypothetical protein